MIWTSRKVSSQPLEHGCHTGHMALGFSKGGNAAVAGDRMGTGIVGRERQRGIAELLKHHQKVTGRAVEVLGDVMGIDAEIARGIRHQLAEPDGPDRAQGARIIGALDLDIGAVEQRPIADRHTRLTQGVMATVAQRCGLDGVEDFGGGADGAWGDRCGSRHIAQGSIIPTDLRCCKEKEAIRKESNLGIFFASERAQTAGALGGIDQSAIRADLEDETVGKGQGRGTNACTQCNDERKRAVSCP